MSKSTPRGIILRLLALLISTLPAAVCTLCYFPTWKSEGGEVMLSGVAVTLLCLGAIPIIKHVRRLLASPSVPIIWLMVFLLFLASSRIAEQMLVISLVGFLSNCVGAVIYRLAARGDKNEA